VIFCLPLLQNLVFGLSFSFCNLVFLSVSAIILVFCLLFRFCNLVSASAIWYQLLQFGISVLSLQLFWYFVFSLVSAIWYQLLQFGISVLSLQLFWYFVFSSVSAIWYFCFVSAIVLVFHLLFSFCNLVFELSFCKKNKKIWSDILSSASAKSGISTFLQLLSWHLLPKRLFGYVGYLLI